VRRLLVLLAAAALCAGCVSSALKSDNDAPEIYRLDGASIAAGADSLPLALSVARPRAASSLDTERIAVVTPGGGFDYFAGVRWADPAPQMLQQLLVQAFAADGRFAATVAAPSRVPTDLMLDVELRQFEAVYADEKSAPRVRVEMQVTLVDSRKGTRVASFRAAAEAAAARNRQQSVVAAYDVATDEALRTVVARVRESTASLAR
jgi:cholesterol transport system auxiliary component